MDFSELIDRVDGVRAQLSGQEQEDARHVLAISRGLTTRTREDGLLVAHEEDLELKRELGRMVEVLSRRSAKAIVVATLGRAALADLSRSKSGFEAACTECNEKLVVLGL
jgi:hypothetical protein